MWGRVKELQREQGERKCETYGCIFGSLGVAALQGNSVSFMLESLRSDKTLDTGSFGVGFLAFAFGLDFAANDEFAHLTRQD